MLSAGPVSTKISTEMAVDVASGIISTISAL